MFLTPIGRSLESLENMARGGGDSRGAQQSQRAGQAENEVTPSNSPGCPDSLMGQRRKEHILDIPKPDSWRIFPSALICNL